MFNKRTIGRRSRDGMCRVIPDQARPWPKTAPFRVFSAIPTGTKIARFRSHAAVIRATRHDRVPSARGAAARRHGEAPERAAGNKPPVASSSGAGKGEPVGQEPIAHLVRVPSLDGPSLGFRNRRVKGSSLLGRTDRSTDHVVTRGVAFVARRFRMPRRRTSRVRLLRSTTVCPSLASRHWLSGTCRLFDFRSRAVTR